MPTRTAPRSCSTATACSSRASPSRMHLHRQPTPQDEAHHRPTLENLVTTVLNHDTAPRLDKLMTEIEALGHGTVEYHEAMWMLLSVMARRQAIIADRLRGDQIRRANREARRAKP